MEHLHPHQLTISGNLTEIKQALHHQKSSTKCMLEYYFGRNKIVFNGSAFEDTGVTINDAIIADIFAQGSYPVDAKIITKLCVEGFRDMKALPLNLYSIFPNITSIEICDCPSFIDLSTIVLHAKLERLSCINCETLDSLTTLSTIPKESALCHLRFWWCGLSILKDDWLEGFESLSNVNSTKLDIDVYHCNSLTCLPTSIARLAGTRIKKINISLVSNSNMTDIPSTLGDLNNLKSLTISNCPNLWQLPWQLTRLNSYVAFHFTDMPHLLSNIGLNTSNALLWRFDEDLDGYLHRMKSEVERHKRRRTCYA